MTDESRLQDAILKVLMTVLLVGGFLFLWHRSATECSAKHGVLVRGAFWFACVAPP